MKPIIDKKAFVSNSTFLKLTENSVITDAMDLGELGFFVSYEDTQIKNIFFICDRLKFFSNHKVSVGIASAVTAYSRVYMSKFKNRDDIKLYYSDTDSIFVDGEIPHK